LNWTKRPEQACKPNSVTEGGPKLFHPPWRPFVCGRQFPAAWCDLPGGGAGHSICLPTRSCSERGLPGQPVTGLPVVSYTTVSA